MDNQILFAEDVPSATLAGRVRSGRVSPRVTRRLGRGLGDAWAMFGRR